MQICCQDYGGVSALRIGKTWISAFKGDIYMGFFAGELAMILQAHLHHTGDSPWETLTRIGVHPQQIDRLKKASEDIGQIANMQESYLIQLCEELELTPLEWARLQAGIETDMFFRLLLHHGYRIEVAANRANDVFASALKDRLALGGKSDEIYAGSDQAQATPKKTRRTRANKRQDIARVKENEER